jgi:hypothetical protein
MKAIKDMNSLKETCRLAFEGAPCRVSRPGDGRREQQQHEFPCPKSGCSIDMIPRAIPRAL